MNATDASAVVTRFNAAINDGDLEGLEGLMTEDHAFVDSDGTRVDGRDACLDLWRQFFAGFPDYENVFESVTTDGDTVTVVGHSNCPDERLDGPAIWTAEVRDGKLAEWRVYEDTAENRRELGIEGR